MLFATGIFAYVDIHGIDVASLSVQASPLAPAPTTTSCYQSSSFPNVTIDWLGNGTINMAKFITWLNQNQTNEGMLGSINATQLSHFLGNDSTLSINQVQIQIFSNSTVQTIHFVFSGDFHLQESWGYLNTNTVVIDYQVPSSC